MEEEYLRSYDEYADALFRHCYFRVSDTEVAKDLVQDTFMKVWDTLRKGKKIKNWRTFLFSVLNNRIIDHYRKKKSSSLDAMLEEEEVNEGMFEDLQSGGLDEEMKKISDRENERILTQALNKLQKNYAQVIVMRYIDELKPKEIAQILGEKQSVISMRIHRGIKKLKDIL